MNKIKNNIYRIWKNGYLYAGFAIILFLRYALNDNVGVMDWYKDSAYLHYIKSALTEFDTLPYFWWSKITEISWIPPIQATSVFIAVPETSLFSPLTPLLYFLSEIVYLKLYILVQCLIGLSGVYALRKRLNWNNIQFRTYLVVFIFSPIIFQHIAIGYVPWYNIFFFPWLIFFLAESQPHLKTIGISAVLSLVLLQGGVYVFVWFVMILLLYGFYNIFFSRDYKNVVQILIAITLVSLLAHARIYSTSLSYVDFSREWFEIKGYNPFNFLFYALIPTITIQPVDLLFWTNLVRLGIPPHDAGLFWGLVIIMVLVIVINYKKIFKEGKSSDKINYRAIFFAATTIFVFSFFSVWVNIMRLIQTLIDLPFFESIKNYGYRLGIPAYLGFSLLAANYVENIWDILLRFLNNKPWLTFKKTIIIIFKVVLSGLTVVFLIMLLFKSKLVDQIHKVVTAAYNNTDHLWLRNKMEGIAENDLNFYFYRFEGLYTTAQYILFILLCVLFTVLVISLLMKINRQRIKRVTEKYPYLKLELALILPLMFSTFMWVNLATRTPFENYTRQEVLPPKVVVISNKPTEQPALHATPQKLIITPTSKELVSGYLFPDIKASEYKNLNVTSRNGILFDSHGQLMVKPLDDKPINIEFETKKIIRSIWITLISWVITIVLFVGTIFRNRKLTRQKMITENA